MPRLVRAEGGAMSVFAVRRGTGVLGATPRSPRWSCAVAPCHFTLRPAAVALWHGRDRVLHWALASWWRRYVARLERPTLRRRAAEAACRALAAPLLGALPDAPVPARSRRSTDA
jgi:hypothetical protein